MKNEILMHVAALMGIKIDPEKSILFLDEIQAAPHLLEKLRWFAEDMPELPVIVAGSLLDFALAKHEFSMPVGRIGYLYLEPLSFEEFLNAIGQKELRSYLEQYEWNLNIPMSIHIDLLTTYRDDFAKYNGRLSIQHLEDVMNSVPRQLGQKFVYKNANPEIPSGSLKQALGVV